MRPPRTFSPLSLLRTSLLTATLVASLARAQTLDELYPRPHHSPPTPASPAAVKSALAANDKQPATQALAAPTAGGKQPAQGATAESEPVIVSTQERFLPEGEQHSPSTLHNAWTDPKNLRHTSSAVGDVGLLRVAGADPGARGVLRFSVLGEYFKSGDFPVVGAQNTRSSATFSASYVPLDFLEFFAAYSASANTNSRSSPNLIQALGDITVGARASRQWTRGFWAGVDVRALSFSGVGNQDVSQYVFGFSPRVVATYDVRERYPKIPLRVHGNLGMVLDGTGNLVNSTQLNAAEEYALNVNRYTRVSLALGAEAPLPGVTPFLEFNLAYPLGVEGDGLIAPDGQTVSAASAAYKTLNLGAKVTAVRDVTFTVGAELGLTRAVGLGVPATPPVNLVLGVSYAVDLLGRGGTRIIETVRERKVEGAPLPTTVQVPPTAATVQTAQVSGVVLDAQTHKPLAGVLVTVPGAGLPPVATEAGTGRFLTQPLPAGPVRLAAQKDGYLLKEQDLRLTAGQTSTVELTMEAMARPAVFTVSTTAQKKPVAATLSFQGPKNQELTTSDSAAPAKLELPPGHYIVNVTAKGYLAQTRGVQLSDGATLALSFELEPEPKKKLVEVKGDKLELQQQLHFGNGKSEVLADNSPLLAQVVDAIVRNGIKRVRIEAHTDNQGDPAVNLKLSKDRAQAVAAFLTKAGIDASRLEAEGYGDTRPIAPNLTPRGRELNRRVEFLILER
ncbi:MAG: OmpA family protein [Hyalangium sp.]|uniref:OmpA family protein n=1 Tax=Hyalangium sp. TaxID=2028555 RepID=UPI00389A7BB2